MKHEYYWVPLPGVDPNEPLPGKLIVLEGTDGVGRSTQTRMLRNWLESSGLAVYDTGLRRGQLAGSHIQQAKEGHTLGRRTQALFYATDFADRLENEILPALRSGYVVLTDRYIYSLIARSSVRGVEREWLQALYGFALKPDLVLYLRISLEKLLPRVLARGGFDYWESGMDYLAEDTMYDAFVHYQRALLSEFESMVDPLSFVCVDANQSVRDVFSDLRSHVKAVVADMMVGQPGFTSYVGVVPPPEVTEEAERRSLTEMLRDALSSLLDDN